LRRTSRPALLAASLAVLSAAGGPALAQNAGNRPRPPQGDGLSAADEAYLRRQAEYEAQKKADEAAFAAAQARYERERAEAEARRQRELAEWEAKVRACKKDKGKACGQ
jgi:hypothetical protein